MKNIVLQNIPIDGKTFSLFGNSNSTDDYYRIIKMLTDKILNNNPDINSVINIIQRFSSKKRYLRNIINNPDSNKLISNWMIYITDELKQFTQNVEVHLKALQLSNIWDRKLRTTREQYHLYMLEIELMNRLYIGDFNKSDNKIALLPHCLRDFSANCKAAKNGFDFQCRHCSPECFQNHASAFLKKNQIEPFIWMGGDLKRLAKTTIKSGKNFGVLGIACIPELVSGMRKCHKYKIPVIGLPLNANRCRRWFGEFLPNSINLHELEKLVMNSGML